MRCFLMCFLLIFTQKALSFESLRLEVTREEYLSFDYLPKCLGGAKKVLEKALKSVAEDCGSEKGEVGEILSQSVSCSPSQDAFCECQARVRVVCELLQ